MSSDVVAHDRAPKVGIVVADAAAPRDTHADVAAAARCAESVGLDSLWAGDHLAMGDVPLLDSSLVLAASAAATRRILIGSAVFVPALRPPAWAVKQIATLVQLCGERPLQLGIAAGAGLVDEHRMAGLAARGRGARTDAFLAALPAALAGQRTQMLGPDGPVDVQLAPPVRPPPVWIGGSSDAALRRVVRHGRGWLAALLTPTELADRARRLDDECAVAARPQPGLGLVCHASISRPGQRRSRDDATSVLRSAYGLDADRASDLAVAGSPADVAEQLQRFVDVGVEHLVVIVDDGPWQRSCDLLADVRTRLGS